MIASSIRKRTVRDVEVNGKRVLARVDFNVPLRDEDNQRVVADDQRIRAGLPTIRYLLDRGASVVLTSHLGRPQGRDNKLSLQPVATRLSELLGQEVQFSTELVGDEASQAATALRSNEVLLLENSRFESGETENDPELARKLAGLADIFVEDAFGAVHRAHATTVGVAEYLPSAAGLLVEKELAVLGSVLKTAKRPLVVVLGGAKVSDKVALLERFLELADSILIGGAMCFSFFRTQGRPTGDSLVDGASVAVAADVLAKAKATDCELVLPVDLVVADAFSAEANCQEQDSVDVADGRMGLDIGPKTAELYCTSVLKAGTVFWNGPMGAFELEPFSAGTRRLAEAVAESKATSIIGGGDSAAAVAKFGLADKIDHISTGGGASLEFLEGKKLPGVEVLDDA